MRTAVIAPSPLNSSNGDLPRISDSTATPATPYRISLTTWTKLITGRSRATSDDRRMSTTAFNEASMTRTATSSV